MVRLTVLVDCSNHQVQDLCPKEKVENVMSIEQASAFLDNWVNENVHAVAHPKDNTEAMQLALRCLEAAEAHGSPNPNWKKLRRGFSEMHV